MNIYGAVQVNGHVYEDDEIYRVPRNIALSYGADWTFAGDQLLEDSDITVTFDDGFVATFKGMTALPDFLRWCNT